MWILIISLYAGMLSSKDSVALTSIPGFKSYELCDAAGHKATNKLATLLKGSKYICVKAE